MNMNYEILGQRLRLARERSRISQTEAAQVIDVTAAISVETYLGLLYLSLEHQQ